MSNYSNLKAILDANIKTNGNQEITGSVLNSVLKSMVDSLGAGYQYMGVATPSTNPGTPDQKVFYIAEEPGLYTNFGGATIDGIALLIYDASWSIKYLNIATNSSLARLRDKTTGLYVSSNTNEYYDFFGKTGDVVVVKNLLNFKYHVYFRKTKGTEGQYYFEIGPNETKAVTLEDDYAYVFNFSSDGGKREYIISIKDNAKIEEIEGNIELSKQKISELDKKVNSTLYTEKQADLTEQTQSGKYIDIAGNEKNDLASFSLLIYSVENISKVHITTSNHVGYASLYAFYRSETFDSSNIAGDKGPNINSIQSFDADVDVPEGAKYLVISKYQTMSASVIGYKLVNRFDALEEEIENAGIDEIFEEISETPESELYKGQYINTNGSLASLGAYNLYAYNIDGYKSVRMVASGLPDGAIARIYGFYSGMPFGPSTLIGNVGPAMKEVAPSYDISLDIPAGAKYLVYTDYPSTSKFTVSAKKTVNRLTELKKKVDGFTLPIQYKIDEEQISIACGYGQSDILIVLKKKGGNNLFDFYGFYTFERGKDIGTLAENELKTIQVTTSDWHAPFIVKAVNNADGDNPSSGEFTGGNHEYTNTGSGGTPTAKSLYVRFYIDGEQKTSGFGRCSNIRMEWANEVQAANTKKADGSGRSVLREYHVMTFDGFSFTTNVELVPLEDITMGRWYGLQTNNSRSVYTDVKYVGAVNRQVYRTDENSESGNKLTNAIECYGNDDKITLEVDRTYDLGNGSLMSDESGMFASNYGKCYCFIIRDKDMKANNHYYLRGKYTFDSNNS